MLTTEDEGGISVGVDPVYHSDLSSHTPRATVARVLTEVVDDSSTIGKGIPFTGGRYRDSAGSSPQAPFKFTAALGFAGCTRPG